MQVIFVMHVTYSIQEILCAVYFWCTGDLMYMELKSILVTSVLIIFLHFDESTLTFRGAEPYEEQCSKLGIRHSPAIPYESKKEKLQRMNRNKRKVKSFLYQSEEDSPDSGNTTYSKISKRCRSFISLNCIVHLMFWIKMNVKSLIWVLVWIIMVCFFQDCCAYYFDWGGKLTWGFKIQIPLQMNYLQDNRNCRIYHELFHLVLISFVNWIILLKTMILQG